VQTTHLKQGWLRRDGLPESDQAALVEFFVRHGEQVQAARLTADYDPRYGATTGPWTTDMFVEAVYRDLSRRK